MSYVLDWAIMTDLFRRAYTIAEQSPDPSTRNGAILVQCSHTDPPEIVAEGFNVILPKLLDVPESYADRSKKYPWISHAEARVLGLAAQHGVATLNLDMICPWACCLDCATTIVEHGIKRVVAHADALRKSNESQGDRKRWGDTIAEARQYLDGAGVEFIAWEGKIGGVRNLFAGSYWEP